MKFLINMADVEDEWETLSQAERDRVMKCQNDFKESLGDKHVVCYGIRPSGEARTVRMLADGRIEEQPGPITQTKEPVGGFYIIEADSIETAVEWAKKGRFRPGPNEVRELIEG